MYLAGVSTGWFTLANERESIVFPRFEYHYGQLCKRVMTGEDLHLPVTEALPEKTERTLTADERQAHIAQIRKELGL